MSTLAFDAALSADDVRALMDEVRARVHDVTRIVEVVRVIQRRVGAADAVTCFIDRTPPPPPESLLPVPRRDRGAGRPTKRERRLLDEFRTLPPYP